MRLSLTSWSLRALTLPEAVAVAKAVGIDAIDLGYFYRPGLSRAAVLADPEGEAAKVRDLGIHVPNFYHLFGDSLADRNNADPGARAANRADFSAVLRFARTAAIPTVFVLPGVVNAGQSRAEALAASAESLGPLAEMAGEAGVKLLVEPHVHGLLESPAATLDLLSRVKGLGLALDYAHFVCLGWRQDEIDPLAPHAGHVHVRQARPGVLQAKLDAGTINMAAMLGTLRDAGYRGALALEVVHQDYMGTLGDDVLTETLGLRDLVRGWLR